MKVCGLLLLCVMLAGCENMETADQNGERARRAVESPTERGSSGGEMAQMSRMEGVPIVTVDFPNREDQAPKVRTIVDNVMRPEGTGETIRVPETTGGVGVMLGGVETQPATRPVRRVDPLRGE